MTRALFIDSGKHAIGYVYADAILVAAGCVRGDPKSPANAGRDVYEQCVTTIPNFRPDLLVAEAMVWRPNDRKSQPNDLLAVTRTTAHVAVACRVGAIRDVPASEWKGNLAKEIHHARIDLCLDEREREIVRLALASTTAGHAKEVLDAVGIWLYYAGRTDRAGRDLRTKKEART